MPGRAPIPPAPVSLDALRWASLPEPERLYARQDPRTETGPLRLPNGRFRGHYLRLVDSRGARRLENGAMV